MPPNVKKHTLVTTVVHFWSATSIPKVKISSQAERVFFSVVQNREDAKRDIVDYIEMFYTSKRRHSYLGYLSLREFEKRMVLKKAA